MLVSYDPKGGATYVRLSDDPSRHTESVSDLVMVNVDADGQPVGVEFAVAPHKITDAMIARVVDRFPTLKDLLNTRSWLLTHA